MDCLYWGLILTEKSEVISTNAPFLCLEVRDVLTAYLRRLIVLSYVSE